MKWSYGSLNITIQVFHAHMNTGMVLIILSAGGGEHHCSLRDSVRDVWV